MPGTAYTFALVNNGSGISLMQITDTPCTNRNAACVRAVNLSPNSGPVDMFLSGAGRVFQCLLEAARWRHRGSARC